MTSHLISKRSSPTLEKEYFKNHLVVLKSYMGKVSEHKFRACNWFLSQGNCSNHGKYAIDGLHVLYVILTNYPPPALERLFYLRLGQLLRWE